MYTLILDPVLKDSIWGGVRLKEEFGFESESERIAEAWVLSCHPDGRCHVKNGEFEGKTLAEVLSVRREWMGTHAKNFKRFPLLIKLIDSAEGTSIHVHPDDEYAAALPDRQGKLDLWYIIDAKEGAEVTYGFQSELTQEQLRRGIEGGSLCELLERFPVKAGDIFMLEPGTVHAIGNGVLLCEIQQSANTSFRLDDFGRVDGEESPRELNIPAALDVAITSPPTTPPGSPEPPAELDSRVETLIGECEHFKSVLMDISGRTRFFVGDKSFASIVVIDGEAKLFTNTETLRVHKGDSLFIPAKMGRLTVSGNVKIIVTTI